MNPRPAMKYLALLLVLSSHWVQAQPDPIRWAFAKTTPQAEIVTKKTDYLLQLEAVLPGLDSAEQPVIQLYRNGVPYVRAGQKLGNAKLPKSENGHRIFTEEVALLEGENTWVAEITTKLGKSFKSAPQRIVRKTGKPNLYLLSVGVPYNLKYTSQDARAIFSRFKTQAGYLFGKVEGQVLICDENTRFSQLGQTLSELQNQELTEDDVLILFFSSHGIPSNAFGETDFGVVSNDAHFGVRDERYVLLMYQKDIISNISALPCKRVIFLDACHSGVAGGDKSWIGTLQQAQTIITQTPSGIVTIASSSGNESSFESETWGHGAFTYALLEGLGGKADSPNQAGQVDHTITLLELVTYVKGRVPELVRKVYNKTQTPMVAPRTWADYPIFNYRASGKEIPAEAQPCVPLPLVAPAAGFGSQLAVLGVVSEKWNQVDWSLSQKATEALHQALPGYTVKSGKTALVEGGTAVSILDGYWPPGRNLATELEANYLCIITRRPTEFRSAGTTNKWVAKVKSTFSFYSTLDKSKVFEQEFEETGTSSSKTAAEQAGLSATIKKLTTARIPLPGR